MSLLVQMDRDLSQARSNRQSFGNEVRSCDASNEELQNSTELPLFAAANAIQQRNHKRRRMIWLALLIVLVVGGYILWPLIHANTVSKTGQIATHENVLPAAFSSSGAHAVSTIKAVTSETGSSLANVSADTELQAESVVIEPAVQLTQVKQPEVPDEVHIEPPPATIASVDLNANTAALEQQPSAITPLLKSAPVKSALEQDGETALQANQMLESGRGVMAMSLLQQALEKNPGWNQSRQQYIGALIGVGEYAKAGSQIQAYALHNTNKSRLQNLQARLLIAQQQYREAINLLASTAGTEFEADRWALLGSAYQLAGLWAEAATSYRRLIANDSSDPRWWLGLAVAYDAANKKQQARQAYIEALRNGHALEPGLQNYAKSRLASL